jgi:hypothetical protein
MIFFDEPPQYSGLIDNDGRNVQTYEESADAAQLYNPLSGTVKSQALFTGTRVFPLGANPA